MSSHVVVISTDLRRATVKVTPGTYLIDVLEQACKKFNISSDKYLIKHKQKHIDLSVPYRTSGLVAGAKLELVQKSNTPSAIQIALQLPQPEAKEIPGGRLIKKFPSDLTFWKVLRQFESGDASAGRNINITARGIAQTTGGSGAGQLYYETPVLNIMGRELSSFADFQKTMSQLGHNSGNVLIRLTFKKTDQPLYEAMKEMGEHFKEEEDVEESPEPAGENKKPQDTAAVNTEDTPMADAPSTATPSITSDLVAPADQNATTPAETDSPSVQLAPEDPYQPVDVYMAPSSTTPAAALAPPQETDYTPTVAHAQLHQARLQESSRNKRLLSDKELDDKAAAEEARINSIKSVLVKIRFPDNTSSDWQVDNTKTGSFLYEAVRHVMSDRSQPFHLVMPGGKTVIVDDSSQKHNLVRTYKLAGRVLLNLVWDDKASAEARNRPFLKNSVAQQSKSIRVQDIPQPRNDGSEKEQVAPQLEKKDDGQKSEGGAKKVPKWFKIGKK